MTRSQMHHVAFLADFLFSMSMLRPDIHNSPHAFSLPLTEGLAWPLHDG